MSGGIVCQWRVVNVWSGAVVVVEAVGARDAVFSVAGWQRVEARGGWLYAGSWKVETRAQERIGGGVETSAQVETSA